MEERILKAKSFLSFFDNSDKMKLRFKFNDMKQRCYNQNNKNYNLYGGNGITICDEWLEHPILFLEWSFKNGYSNYCNSIDRIDNTKGYSPDNCRYVNVSYQNYNKYQAKYEDILINGKVESKSIKQWSLYFQISYNRMKYIFRKKETGGKGLKGQEIIDFLKKNKEGIYKEKEQKEYIKEINGKDLKNFDIKFCNDHCMSISQLEKAKRIFKKEYDHNLELFKNGKLK